MSTRGVAALVLLPCLLAASPVSAEERTRVAVLDLLIEGDAPAELRQQLDRSLAGGLYAAGFEVVARADVAAKLRGAPELVGCTTTTCLEKVGTLVGARRFVRARVEASGASYTIELTLLGADVEGAVVRRAERSCAVCTISEANDAMSQAAADLGARVAAPTKVKVLLKSDPPGAQLEVDGEAVGVTPVTVELVPGEHAYRAERSDGGGVVEGRFAAEAKPDGSPVEVAIGLAAVTPVEPAPPRASRFRVWKWASAGGAAAALVTGVTLIAIDGNGVDCESGALQCPSVRDTMAGGVALTAVGVGLGGLAAWMFMHDGPPAAAATAEGRSAAVVPLRGGAAVTLSLTF